MTRLGVLDLVPISSGSNAMSILSTRTMVVTGAPPAVTRFPSVMSRSPTMPVISALIVQYPRFRSALFTAALFSSILAFDNLIFAFAASTVALASSYMPLAMSRAASDPAPFRYASC